jgi:hypothetical protein
LKFNETVKNDETVKRCHPVGERGPGFLKGLGNTGFPGTCLCREMTKHGKIRIVTMLSKIFQASFFDVSLYRGNPEDTEFTPTPDTKS